MTLINNFFNRLRPSQERFLHPSSLIILSLYLHEAARSGLMLMQHHHTTGIEFIFCMKFKSRSNNPLAKRARKGFRGFPVATVAFYGPDDQRASKLVIGIITHEGAEPKLKKWYTDDADLRSAPEIESEIKAFIKEHGVLSVSMANRIIGCPHEEGIDYPDGESCSQCPFWRDRDRFTGEMIN